jgi:fused signal recognition particle receptor
VIRGALDRLRRGLRKTRVDFLGRLGAIFGGRVRLDADTLDQIEELLLRADMGVAASLRITRTLEQRVRAAGGEATLQGVLEVIRADARDILVSARPRVRPPGWAAVEAAETGGSASGGGGAKRKKGRAAASPPPADAPEVPAASTGPEVLLIVGVNGTGKTTSIAKLAALHKAQGRSVLLAAADTFRAAAVEQLSVWADRVGVPCVRQGQGADPAAVVFDALSAAAARGHDLVIVDTAGRLHTRTNLMAEMAKIARVIERRTGRHPRTLLVVDANTGQNGLAQARVFAETIPVDGLILAKLDGTAKGGIVIAIAEEIGLPVLYVGTGETAADLAEFDVDVFLEAFFADWQGAEEGEVGVS